MDIIQSKLVKDSTFQDNANYHSNLLQELKQKEAKVMLGGGERSVEKHRSRNKFLARERIERIIDPGTNFLELSRLAGFEVYDFETPSAGLITGIGQIQGQEVLIIANDATVKGGTYFPLTVKKHLRAQEIALENNLPCLYLVDSGGAFLPMQGEVFPDKEHFGRIFYNQAQMSSRSMAQVSVVLGSCTAGGAYVPAMSDESVIVKGNGTIFLGGPPLVKAATGEEVSSEDLGGAMVHTSISGVSDHLADNENHAFEIVRDLFQYIPHEKKNHHLLNGDWEEPLYSNEELMGIVSKNSRIPFDIREVIARIVDGSKFHEFKKNFGETLVCGFSEICGIKVGIIANNGILFSESSLKGAHFIELCSQRKIPLVFLQNITGFMVGQKFENEGIAKHGAKLVTAVSTTSVPKFTVVIGGSFGAGNYGMCGRAFNPRFMWMWPNARISVMGGEQAANVLSTVKQSALEKQNKKMTDQEIEDFQKPILEKYEKEGSAYYSSARIWDDGIIDPRKTRKYLALGLAASLNREIPKSQFGIFRM